ncbi:MAG TPA: alpha/beta hydrolase-fold protein [Chitinophagaceae bacterium]|nr:alpha/beta hydrolase-fold protein [Chitinophagaceae bacterium]
MKNILTITLLFTAFRLAAQYPSVQIPGSEIRVLKSGIVKGQEYELHILLPGSYKKSEKKYPVVYLMDSQWDFPLVKSLYGQHYYDGFIAELIIVGVTWGGTNPNPDSLRARDYTPSKEQRLPQSGGADQFLSFIKNELFPFIETQYRAQDNNRGLMGCSLGGLFTLYTLFTQPELFDYYAAASPALGWDNGILYQFEKIFAQKKTSRSKRVFMTIGDVERSRPLYEKFVDQMKKGKYPFVSRVLVNTGHSGTKNETYGRGLQYFFERPKLHPGDAVLQKYCGTYTARNGNTVEIIKENNQLKLYLSKNNKYLLYAASDTSFYTDSEFLNIQFDNENGKTRGFQLNQYGQSQYLQKTDSLTGKVYKWNDINGSGEFVSKTVLDGGTTSLSRFRVMVETIGINSKNRRQQVARDEEELIIIKEGEAKISLRNSTKSVGRGSVAFIMAGDKYEVTNSGKGNTVYYRFSYKGKISDPDRALKQGGSFIIDWNALDTSGTGKGYRRNFFDRASSQLRQFEMHTTALNAGAVSHAPHTHVQEEIVLILRGDVTMHIDGALIPALPGDVVFLPSGVPHALNNTGADQCEYFAFQWRN